MHARFGSQKSPPLKILDPPMRLRSDLRRNLRLEDAVIAPIHFTFSVFVPLVPMTILLRRRHVLSSAASAIEKLAGVIDAPAATIFRR